MVAGLSAAVLVIFSAFTYLQNLAATIDLPDFHLPPEINRFFSYVTKFLERIFALIPGIPAFDARAHLVVVAFILPFLLTMLFVWLLAPVSTVLQDTLDLVVMIFVAMPIAESIVYEWTTGTVLATVLGATFVVVRLIMMYAKQGKNVASVADTVKACGKVYFSRFNFPGTKTSWTALDMWDNARHYTRFVDFDVTEPSKCSVAMMVLAVLVMIGLTLWTLGAIPSKCPGMLQVFFPYFGYPLTVILLLSLICKVTVCGRRIMRCLKNFIKTKGARLLMPCLDVLYIPILTSAIPLLIPRFSRCAVNEYLQYDRVSIDNDPLFDFVNHTAACAPCSPELMKGMEMCQRLCSGLKELRLLDPRSLLFVDDVLKPMGGLLLYVIFICMLGIPGLFYYVTTTNRKVVQNLFIYGNTEEEKWKSIVRRLDTIGVAMFADYKYGTYWWGIAGIGIKFLVMLITSIAGRVWTGLIYALPVVFLGAAIMVIYWRPYMVSLLNFANVVLWLLQCFHALVPIFARHGLVISSQAYLGVAIALLVVPVICLLLAVFWRLPPLDEDDPTLTSKEMEKARVTSARGKRHHFDFAGDDWDLHADDLFKRMADTYKQRAKEGALTDTMEMFDPFDRPSGKKVPICIVQMDRLANLDKRQDQFAASFEVDQGRLRGACLLLYKLADFVLTAATIRMLARIVYWAMITACIAFGWYIGALRGLVRGRSVLLCGTAFGTK
jgi:hypothetical protein